MNKCHVCGAEATRTCTRCGKPCCDKDIYWANTIGVQGVICRKCQSFGLKLTLIGIVIAAAIIGLMLCRFW
jgi:hypothetical protein